MVKRFLLFLIGITGGITYTAIIFQQLVLGAFGYGQWHGVLGAAMLLIPLALLLAFVGEPE